MHNKNEAIDFLLEKMDYNIDYLKNKIKMTISLIKLKDIIAFEKCIFHLKKMKNLGNNFEIFSYIKSMDQESINQFENYSKHYTSIIELETNDNT